jgi:hypothetical protein
LKSLTKILARFGNPIITIVWMATTILYINIYGLITNLEATKYIREANYLLENGSFSEHRYLFYSLTIFVIAISIKLKLGIAGAFIFQALFNLFAYIFFYSALKKLFKTSLTPLVIVVYLLLFNPYQSWIVYLYTESIFFSTILILLSVLIVYQPDKLKNIILTISILFLTILARPLGILFGLAVYFYFFYHSTKKWKTVMVFISVFVIIIGYHLINSIFSNISDWSITKPFVEGSIICDLPSELADPNLDLKTTGNPISQLLYYVSHNFKHFIQFTGTKLKYFFFMTRTYYSNSHNYFLLLNIIPIYSLALITLFNKNLILRKDISLFKITTIVIYSLTIVFQCDDYHNRFILSIYPFFVIYAAVTLERILLARRN